jgi:indolepyruvate ferredoxin oxidoreductase
MTAVIDPARYSLDERWGPGNYPAVLTGVQAVGRMLVEQHIRDRRTGLRTATFVSGY